MTIRILRLLVPAACLIASGIHLGAQVFEVKGGSSTLYEAQGGTITMHTRSFDASAGIGTVAGRLVGGAQWSRKTPRASYILGSENIPFNLPTDIFDSDHFLTGIGVSVKTSFDQNTLFAFAGVTSASFNSPYFEAATTGEPAGILIFNDRLGPAMIATTSVMLARKNTLIESFEFTANPSLKVGVSVGVGADQPYAATSLAIKRPRFDLKAAYIATGSAFRRVDVDTPLTSEPVRENVSLTFRPARDVILTAARQNYLTPVTGTAVDGTGKDQEPENARSAVNQVSASFAIRGTGISATFFQSSYQAGSDLAVALSANFNVGERVHAAATFLSSIPSVGQPTNSFVTNLQETLSPRWTVSQMINVSNGQTSLGYGGSFLSNRLTFSAEYQTYYVPERVAAPFQQTLIIDARVHLFGRITLGGGTFVSPTGKLLYTTEIEGEFAREQAARHTAERNAVGPIVVRGRVVDATGNPIAGAAILIDQAQVYSDSDGYFYLRERRARTHVLTVLVNQFLDGVYYRLLAAPTTLRSGPEESLPESTVVVEALPPGGA